MGAERFGQKNGKGFYKYDEKLRYSPDPEADALVQACWENTGVTQKNISEEEIIDRLYLPVVNEGFKCLEEGMAIRPSDIDICCAVGLKNVLAKIESMGMKPSALLKECVEKKWKLN